MSIRRPFVLMVLAAKCFLLLLMLQPVTAFAADCHTQHAAVAHSAAPTAAGVSGWQAQQFAAVAVQNQKSPACNPASAAGCCGGQMMACCAVGIIAEAGYQPATLAVQRVRYPLSATGRATLHLSDNFRPPIAA